jgi:hypothetical protein
MAIIYRTQEGNSGDRSLHLEYTIGIGAGYSAAPDYLDVSENIFRHQSEPTKPTDTLMQLESIHTNTLLVPLLRRAMQSSEGILVLVSIRFACRSYVAQKPTNYLQLTLGLTSGRSRPDTL